MKKFKYLLILLSLIFLTSCESLDDKLETVDVYLDNKITEYALGDTITVIIKGVIDISVYSSANVFCGLQKMNESGKYEPANHIDLETSIDSGVLTGDLNEFYSFKVEEGGEYRFIIDIFAYKYTPHRATSSFSKNLCFTVK